ncbi:MAG: hypothetical protein INQ03_24085 [Candidatus Heimdallarchaeota archaeon]|nr:hypothetical protein [Candidatus Heimdallarchaeota archaeon]
MCEDEYHFEQFGENLAKMINTTIKNSMKMAFKMPKVKIHVPDFSHFEDMDCNLGDLGEQIGETIECVMETVEEILESVFDQFDD